MSKSSILWLGLCLSSLVATVSLVATTSISSTAFPTQAISQANPCAGKKNPCAAKGGSVGGTLAKKLQGKPVVIDIYASWCPACKNIAPTLSQVKQQYAGKANFVVLDVSDKSKSSQSEKLAKQLGLGKFFAANKAQTGAVAIVDPATGKILAQYRNNAELSAYTSILDAAIAVK